MNWVTFKIKCNLHRNIQKVLNILPCDGGLPEVLLIFNHTLSNAYFLVSLYILITLTEQDKQRLHFQHFHPWKSSNSSRLDCSSSVTVELMVFWDYLKEDISVIMFSSLSDSLCLRNRNEVSPFRDLKVREEACLQVQWAGKYIGCRASGRSLRCRGRGYHWGRRVQKSQPGGITKIPAAAMSALKPAPELKTWKFGPCLFWTNNVSRRCAYVEAFWPEK